MQRQAQIESRLKDAIALTFCRIENESHMHSVPPNSETHFKLTLVSSDFTNLSKVARHQKVYALLGNMMQDGLHAVAIHAYTPEEWNDRVAAPDSPNCMGGSKKNG